MLPDENVYFPVHHTLYKTSFNFDYVHGTVSAPNPSDSAAVEAVEALARRDLRDILVDLESGEL